MSPSQRCPGCSAVHHGAYDFQSLPYPGPPVDEVAHQGMPIGLAALVVAEVGQQELELVGVPVDISDDVVQGCFSLLQVGAVGFAVV